MSKTGRLWLYIIGLGGLMGCYVACYFTFIHAFVSPGYRTVVCINTVGEAAIELVLVNVFLFFGIVVIVDIFKRELRQFS